MTVPCCLRTVRAVYQQVLYGPPMETVAGTYVHDIYGPVCPVHIVITVFFFFFSFTTP
jgi:hypothetical protein